MVRKCGRSCLLQDGIDIEDSVGEARETRGAAVSCC